VPTQLREGDGLNFGLRLSPDSLVERRQAQAKIEHPSPLG